MAVTVNAHRLQYHAGYGGYLLPVTKYEDGVLLYIGYIKGAEAGIVISFGAVENAFGALAYDMILVSVAGIVSDMQIALTASKNIRVPIAVGLAEELLVIKIATTTPTGATDGIVSLYARGNRAEN